jgi:hypothetical protein
VFNPVKAKNVQCFYDTKNIFYETCKKLELL